MDEIKLRELFSLCELVDDFGRLQKQRLLDKLLEGYTGWNNYEFIDDHDPIRTITSYVKEDKWIDAANWLMFFWLHSIKT